MTPVVALVGRPNVGKSTIFNRLTHTRDALVANFPGLTRDRKYGRAQINGLEYIVIDTGGIDGSEEGLESMMAEQSKLAMQEADIVVFVTDARDGVMPGDLVIADFLRRIGRKVILAANKCDGIDADSCCADFYSLAFGDVHQIAASHGTGLAMLAEEVLYPELVRIRQQDPDFVRQEDDAGEISEDDRDCRVSFVFPGGRIPMFREDLSWEYAPLKAVRLQEQVEVEQHGSEITLSVYYRGRDLYLSFADGEPLSGADTCFYISHIQDLPYSSLPEDPGVIDEMRAAEAEPEEEAAEAPQPDLPEVVRFAIVGRPNVGKSTLTNRLLGENRVIVFDMPGTTRDSICIPMERDGRKYEIVDTAGVRKRKKVTEAVEKFSVIKTLQAVEDSHVVILLIDARDGLTDQDLGMLGFIINSGRAVVIAINKWDGLAGDVKDRIRQDLELRLGFASFARIHFISALHGTGVGHLFESVDEAFQSAFRRISTSRATRLLLAATSEHQPPLVKGRRARLKYAHAGGYSPPRIVIHGNHVEELPDSYRRYITNYFRDALKIVGTPLQLEFAEGANPFEGRVNKLTQSQIRKKRRLMRHVKSKKG